MRQIGQSRQHLAGLVAVVVNRLLAQNDQAGLLFVHQGLEQLGHSQGLQVQVSWGLNQDATVCTNGHGGAQGFLALGHAARDGDHFGRNALFFEAHGFFDSDLVKRVHAHLDVGDVHATVVGLHTHLHVVVHHAFHGHENFHLCISVGLILKAIEQLTFTLTSIVHQVDVRCFGFRTKKHDRSHFTYANSSDFTSYPREFTDQSVGE